MSTDSVGAYTEGLRNGDRAALARAITLVESTRPEHRKKAEMLLAACLPSSGDSLRIGVTGVPGVGKSTFIEALGMRLIESGRRVAVLAVDPSSSISGGSILGDKTRMPRLSTNPDAFVRPSPSGGTPGGVARRTRDLIVLCEAAGYDTVFVETIGVGQAEFDVARMVDVFLLLVLAGAGDELQGIKRGILELADAVIVTKADGENRPPAQRARAQLMSALKLFPPNDTGWRPRVHTCSAQTGNGLDEIWSTVQDFVELARSTSRFERDRREQRRYWLRQTIEERLLEQLRADPRMKATLSTYEDLVVAQQISVSEAADAVLEVFRGAASSSSQKDEE